MTLIHGDCIEVMAGMEPESVDAIVTDPPYDLTDSSSLRLGSHPGGTDKRNQTRGFMGKSWDGTGIAFRRETWEAAYRVAKPSAYLLAFGGTRTVHRMTVALEDAGWIIRDMLVWAYASGFPKSKASLKPAWEPIVMARKPGPLRMLAIDECRIGTEGGTTRSHQAGYGESGWRTGHDILPVEGGRWPANVILTDPIFDGGVEGVVGGGYQESTSAVGAWAPRGAFPIDNPNPTVYGDSGTYSRFFEIPGGTSCQWCGRASSAEPSSSPSSRSAASAPSGAATSPGGTQVSIAEAMDSPLTSDTATPSSPTGSGPTTRTRSSRASRPAEPSLSHDPANNAGRSATSFVTIPTTPSLLVCSSCADDAMRSFTGGQASVGSREHPIAYLIPKADRADREPVLGGQVETKARVANGPETQKECPVCGSRFIGSDGFPTCGHGERIYVPQVNRPRANSHPTVKPTDLMRHLVRLVTPTGGVVLDPFLGSGTTALAAEMEGFEWIGIEREGEYIAIAEARLNGTQRGLGLETA